MTTRETVVNLVGGEDQYDSLIDVVTGSLKNCAAAKSKKVPRYTITRARQAVEKLVGYYVKEPIEETDEWNQLQKRLAHLQAAINTLPEATRTPLSSASFENADFKAVITQLKKLANNKLGLEGLEILELAKKAMVEAKAVPQQFVWQPGVIGIAFRQLNECLKQFKIAIRNLSETARNQLESQLDPLDRSSSPEKYEAFFTRLNQSPLADIEGTNLGDIRRFAREALSQVKIIQRSWRKLVDLLGMLTIGDIRDPNLGELREFMEDGFGLVEIAWGKFQKMVELLK